MAEEEAGFEDRTEEASKQKRDDWRKEGRVAQSRDLGAALLLLSTTAALYFGSRWSLMGLWRLFESSFADINRYSLADLSAKHVMMIYGFGFKALLYVIMPIALVSVLTGVLSSIVQFGFVFTTKPLEPDLDKLNPLNGFKRLFSIEGVVELLKACVKFVLVGAVLYFLFLRWVRPLGSLWEQETPQLSVWLGQSLAYTLFIVGGVMALISGLDFAFQKFRFEQKIRMTKQEVKEERKHVEGNPQVRARIRALQRRYATRKMLEDVKKADVVVTNPTHFAVALIYDRESMVAPKVVAKGVDHMCERIKQVAREAGIPIVENPPLARAMYKALKIGQFISRELFNAVAEVLAYVYRLKGRTSV